MVTAVNMYAKHKPVSIVIESNHWVSVEPHSVVTATSVSAKYFYLSLWLTDWRMARDTSGHFICISLSTSETSFHHISFHTPSLFGFLLIVPRGVNERHTGVILQASIPPFWNVNTDSVPGPPGCLLCQQYTVETQTMMSVKLWFPDQL